jgi:hypothetical protein
MQGVRQNGESAIQAAPKRFYSLKRLSLCCSIRAKSTINEQKYLQTHQISADAAPSFAAIHHSVNRRHRVLCIGMTL